MDTTIKGRSFIHKLFDEGNSFPFPIVRMRHRESNIPQNNFCSAIKGEFLRIAGSTLCLRGFIDAGKELLERMKQQSSKRDPAGSSL